MADTYLTLRPTGPGLDGIVQTLYGGSITFTKISVGNGVPADPSSVSEMVNPLLDIGITSITQGDNEVVLTGYTTTEDVEAGFYANEIGIYAKGEDEVEYLFAYSYNATDVDYYPDSSSGRTQELTLTIVVAIGPAENVDAILIEGDAYARKADFDDHVADYNNPHHVTKEQLGLENVQNVSTNDQTPTYTPATNLENLTSGEILAIAFGKIAKAISDLIAHIGDRNNPHRVTLSQVGAAAASHTHSAADINSGTLSAARGGTGSSTLYGSDLAKVRTATLTAAGWSASAPYSQAVNVTGITANDAPIISAGAPSPMNAANYTALIKNFAMIDRAVTSAGKITFYCYRKKPTAAIPLYIKGV